MPDQHYLRPPPSAPLQNNVVELMAPVCRRTTFPADYRWLIIAAIGLTDWLGVQWAKFQLDGYIRFVVCFALIIAISLVYSSRSPRLSEFARFGAQYLTLLFVLTLLGYIMVVTNAPLVDSTFDAVDKAAGLDWVAWAAWVTAHPVFHNILWFAYASLPIQTLFGCLYNAHTGATSRNAEIWWITLIGALLTIGIGALLPGISAWVYYGLAAMQDFPHMQQFEAIRAGTWHTIDFGNTQGFTQLPSFHTVLAIMLTYNLRHNRILLVAAVVLNALVILSCPTEGGHYFCDIAAGALVAALMIWIVRKGLLGAANRSEFYRSTIKSRSLSRQPGT